VSKVAAALLALLAACTCEPNVHIETGYASPAMADTIEQCARERACTILCSRVFSMQPGEIDSCRILTFDAVGGAEVEVSYTTYTCVGEGWATDGDDWSSDPSDPIEDEPLPDDDGAWEDDDSEQDEWDDEDEDDDDSDDDADATGGAV
jgi:hypothetical protein